jgi:hypothetical protein
MSVRLCIAAFSLFISLGSYASPNNCVNDCVYQERDGNILLIKWVGRDGKTKKVFTVDLPADAREVIQRQPKNNISTLNEQVPPDLANGEYRSESSTQAYITATHFVTVITTLFYGPGPRGGEVLLDIKVVEHRVKRTEQTTGD